MQQICTHQYNLCNMNKIGFQNFRRFVDFKPLEYKGITFLVGRNNSGKSTLVKALLLTNDYFRSRHLKSFSFGNNVLEDANIVTYGRAKNQHSEENMIMFDVVTAAHNMRIILTGDSDKTHANVFGILIEDDTSGLQFLFSPQVNEVTISRVKVPMPQMNKESIETYVALATELERLKSELQSTEMKKSSREYIELVDEINTLETKIELIGQHPSTVEAKEEHGAKSFYTYTINYNKDLWFDEIVDLLLEEVHHSHKHEFDLIQQGKENSVEFENLRGVKEDTQIISKSIQRLVDDIEKSGIIYLGANPAKQSALFPIRDKSNALAQAIHDFYQLKIESGEPAYRFVEKWMKEFEVGDSFTIQLHAGEAYELLVQSHGKNIHLADKGMGSIQAMLLILRLACIIHKGKNMWNVVIIEEPEINLHPALQSKLTELFIDVYVHDIWLIIETHSEYIIRKSQVLVAEQELANGINDNPFCVYYFPKDIEHQPYSMEFNADGSFKQNFGEGFFDAASSSTLELIKLKRQKHA